MKSLRRFALYSLSYSIILVLTSVLFLSCSDDDGDRDGEGSEYTELGELVKLGPEDKILILTVASKQFIFDGFETFLPICAKIQGENQWHRYPSIEGFNHQEGYESVIKVWEEKWHNGEVQDVGMFRYKLMKVISMEKKDTEDFPAQHLFITVASKKSKKNTSEPYYIKITGENKWSSCAPINNLDYQEGYEYVIGAQRIFNGSKVNPKFTLTCTEVISKTKKNSEGSFVQ